jgi:CheY-like chemotaxis protein/CHASE3 domain sensor protein
VSELSQTPEGEIDETPLARRLLVALVVPIALLLAAGALLGAQVASMADDAHWVEHSDEVIAKTYELQKQVIDQETGLRGLLVTGNRIFLEPFEKAAPLDVLRQLRALVVDSPSQQDRVDEIGRRYKLWLDETAFAARGQGLDQARTLDPMLDRKARMDSIRAAVDDLLNVEVSLRHQRTVAANASVQATRWAFVGILLALSSVLAFLFRRQLTDITKTFRSALDKEKAARARLQAEDWVRRGHVQVAEAIQGDRSPSDVAQEALRTVASYVGADVGAFYAMDGPDWRRLAGFAIDTSAAGPERFGAGEGLVGQAASQQKMRRIRDVPADYLKVRSGTGERAPVDLVIAPARSDGRTQAVVELGFLREADARAMVLVDRVGETLAVAMRSAEYRVRLQELLEGSRRQSEELLTQQEELRTTNEELHSQTDALRLAHAQLEERKEELEVMNTSLVAQRNELERATRVIEEKAAEVDRTSRYKSEFLANMSHELRTPLNSSLILAKLLASNKDGNLSDEQVKFASMIYEAGNDLLVLINDVLDLSKVEAGKLEIRARNVSPGRVVEEVARALEPLAREKKIAFRTHVDETAPAELETDVQRLQQILRNLLSNAIKFTESGEVSVDVRAAGGGVAFVVTDTGIGISAEQHETIFEAFRQAEGSASRRYGGTGLGLSISRNLARALGGDLSVVSEVHRGSSFTLTLPRVYVPPAEEAPPQPGPTAARPDAARARAVAPATGPDLSGDDRNRIDPNRRLVLVVEDDPAFGRILLDLAHELDFQCLVAGTADEGVRLALERVPSAILLDVKLPDHSGLSVLDRLKRDPSTRHIPVHVVSATDRSQEALAMGAAGYVIKPVQREELLAAFRRLEDQFSRRVRRVLVVEDDDRQREGIEHLLSRDDVEIVAVSTVAEALAKLRAGTFDCVVTDLALPDASGDDLLDQMATDDTYAFPPVIVYTGRSLTADEEQRLRRYSSSIIVKGARSPERLLDEVTLFLHQVESELPADQRRMLRQARDREAVFQGRRILIAEDDVRNIFALTSVLEPKGAEIVIARNGREAIAALEATPGIDLVLMDIMMPEMDGLEAMREIRRRGSWPKLPIVALTAKAMIDDREECFRAGANDYTSKPLDVEMLLSLLRVWMPKAGA